MKRLCQEIPLLALMIAAACGEPAAEINDVIAVQQERFRAMLAGNLDVLNQLLSEQLTYTHTHGLRESKREFMNSIQTGAILYHGIQPVELEAKRYGAVGIITGSSRMRVEVADQEHQFTIRFTDVYAIENGRWRQVVWQATRLAEP